MDKKSLLDNIYYNLGRQFTDFQIFGLSSFKTKWKKYSEVCFPLDAGQTTPFLNLVNNRTICENEIVLDIETKDKTEEIKAQLARLHDCDVYCYDTGSRGIHVHLWYKNPVAELIKRKMIKLFGADELKTTGKPIALENVPHWKTGKKKELIWTLKNL